MAERWANVDLVTKAAATTFTEHSGSSPQ